MREVHSHREGGRERASGGSSAAPFVLSILISLLFQIVTPAAESGGSSRQELRRWDACEAAGSERSLAEKDGRKRTASCATPS